MCENGITVGRYYAQALQKDESRIKIDSTLSSIFINPATESVYIVGDKTKRPDLANTLKIIATEGANALYNGSLTSSFINDIKKYNGIITAEDMKSYNVKWDEAVKTSFRENFTVYSTPPPSSGSILILILNILDHFVSPVPSGLNFHHIVEAFKFAYAQRSGLGDMDFESSARELFDKITNSSFADEIREQIDDSQTFNTYEHYGAQFSTIEDSGTCHISIIAPNGDAISVTSTINSHFGSFVRSNSTGILLNNEMNDFSTPNFTNYYNIPPSPTNFIKPGKQPMSSMTPTIIVDDQNGIVDMVIGAAGGSKITTVVAYIILRHFIFGETLTEAVYAPRLHHQLVPMVLNYEWNFDGEFLKGLRDRGHVTSNMADDGGFAAMTSIAREANYYTCLSDPRRGGSTEVFKLEWPFL